MKFSASDQIKIFLRFCIPLMAVSLAVVAWGWWWLLWSSLTVVTSIGIAIFLRKKFPSIDSIKPVIVMVLPSGILCAFATQNIVNLNPKLASIPYAAYIFPLIWVSLTIFTLTDLSPWRSR
jgi:hypothetical protein